MIRTRATIISGIVRTASFLLLAHAVVAVASAVTLESYKSRIASARTDAIVLEYELRKEDGSRAGPFADRLRAEFPVSERIDWEGGVVESTNDWLLEKASALKEAESNLKQQLLVTVEIREYLSAIAFKLDELEKGLAAEQTKDRDKQKLAEILKREEYQKPQPKQESMFQRWLREFLEWLESLFPKSSGPSQQVSGMGFFAAVLQVLLYGALIGLLVFLVYRIVPLLFPALKRRRAPKKKKERVVLGEHLAEDATAVDLLSEADKLAREGNLRGAIRKGYIALLCDLNDRKVIGLARNKTNRDYLRDVRSRTELHPRMKSVTDIFERHWYGFQESHEQDWLRFREQYHETIQSV